MKSAKLGAIFLIAIMALAGIGMGYAAWTDTITIEGTVNTGNVDIDIEYLSGTWIWKIPPHGFEYWHGWASTDDPPVIPTEATFVASASAEFVYGADDVLVEDEIVISTANLFPCQFFMVDFLVHYDGSVPARIDDLFIDSQSEELMRLYDEGHIGYAAYDWLQTSEEITEDGLGGMESQGDSIDLYGYQLHYCDWILIKLWIHIPQYWDEGGLEPTDDLMGLSADFTARLGVIQWNEFEVP